MGGGVCVEHAQQVVPAIRNVSAVVAAENKPDDAMLGSDKEAVIVECIDDNWREEHKIGEGVVHEDAQGRESSMTQVHQPVTFTVIFTVAWKIPE